MTVQVKQPGLTYQPPLGMLKMNAATWVATWMAIEIICNSVKKSQTGSTQELKHRD